MTVARVALVVLRCCFLTDSADAAEKPPPVHEPALRVMTLNVDHSGVIADITWRGRDA
jgi:hypothetical protein